ncbi:low molecular weight protein-tyrosine-phosphatase [Blastomonas sp.]|uniref:low molecular weight protein-tyrosine-phosphatase n=1 Tax=Blastomonas sp. TaxID=1909299 RepID=UPI002614971F|nr:low molecular weight protein-tyrosine-phosphatase [Blastomonas sp.]MDM7957484.1 low molecular weight protein-tyrosine-phosphatase [Blastomonas sp.]
MTADRAPAILFVCLGNICRSPLADGALRYAVAQSGLRWSVDSAGTGGWHAGDRPDARAIAVAARHGVDIAGLRARQVRSDDFARFDLILAMDHDNLAGLNAIAPRGHRADVRLALDLVDGRAGQAVSDPYYGDAAGFDATWRDAQAIARSVLQHFGGRG